MLQGIKYDGGKLPLGLLFSGLLWPAVQEAAKVLAFGVKKYPDPDNWAKVENARKRYHDALLRHSAASCSGEKLDPESGLQHTAHAACCALFLTAIELLNKDDRVL